MVYTDDDLPVHYSFKSGYGVNSRMERYEQIKARGREYYLAKRAHVNTPEEWAAIAKGKADAVRQITEAQDDQGRWIKVVAKTEQVTDKEGRIGYQTDENTKLQMMYSEAFIANMQTLAQYLTAAQGGPKVKAAGP